MLVCMLQIIKLINFNSTSKNKKIPFQKLKEDFYL